MNILPLDRQAAIISALCEGMSIRATERLTETHRDTIMRLGVRVGTGCVRLHSAMMIDLNVSAIQLDELWAFIGKKQRRVSPEDDATKGDCYTFIAMDQTNKAILSFQSGKRTADTTERFVADLRKRVLGAPMISSDGFIAYEEAVRWSFKDQCQYGQIIKRVAGEPLVPAARRYSPGHVVAVSRRAVFGSPNRSDICTSNIERQNLSVRMASRRFTRLTNGFSKKAENHAAAVALYVAHFNLCRVHETIRTTPAMALGVTDHVWSISELTDAALHGLSEPPTEWYRRFRVIDGGRR